MLCINPGRSKLMEFHFAMSEPQAALPGIERALLEVDPVSLIDIDPDGRRMRVSVSLSAAELLDLIQCCGYELSADDIVQLPSICCGGCSG